MVGIVLVSHSAKLAEAVKELVDQMTQGRARIAVAGGIDDPVNPFGTDALKVQQAIEDVSGADGVLILMDLGSAVLSAEMALDFLPPEQRDTVILSPAPFVEGAMAAGVQASIGGSLAQVAAEAMGGQAPKAEQLGQAEPPVPAPQPGAEPAQLQRELLVRNKLGLHARPASQFVQTAGQFQSKIAVENLRRPGRSADAKSPTGVMLLSVRRNDSIRVSADGADAVQALDALEALVAANFGEPLEESDEEARAGTEEGKVGSAETAAETPLPAVTPSAPSLSPLPSLLRGIPASEGIGIGPAVMYRADVPVVERRVVDDPAAEWVRFTAAVDTAKHELLDLQARAAADVGAENARIFEAHRRFLEDPAILDQARARIDHDHLSAAAAMAETVEDLAEIFRARGASGDDVLAQRATDLEDVGRRVVRLLGTGAQAAPVDLAQPSIVLARELTPSDTATLNKTRVLGLCTAIGGATSHTAILARALGLPAVVGLGEGLLSIADGTMLVVDGTAGEVRLHPDETTLAEYRQRQAVAEKARAAARLTAGELAATRDGRRVEVGANVGDVAGAHQALAQGAEGVGLLRTEFLYLDRSTAPTEDEQLAAYAAIAEALQGRPVIIRSLDIGGDKPAPYLDLGQELNPFLGWRAVRYCLDNPEFFKVQLRAVLRAALDHNLKLMFPMIATITEVRRVRTLLGEANAELERAGVPHAPRVETGIMVETPAAALVADQLAREVDFFSIGTNDLAQYTMAADRTNARVTTLADPLDPAVLRLVKQVIDAGHEAGRWVGMCGEMAGQPEAIPILLGLGLDEFSMSPVAIPRAKQIIRSLTVSQAQEIAVQVFGLDSARAIRDYMRDTLLR